MRQLLHTTTLPHDHREVFAWHERPGAFDRLVPPHQNVRVTGHHPGWKGTSPTAAGEGSPIGDNAEVRIALRQGPLTLEWHAHHDGYLPGRRFRDTQVTGPFATWVHTHRFVPIGVQRSQLIDDVRYAVPGGRLGDLAAGWKLARDLDRTFRWRHRRTEADLARHAPFAHEPRRRVVMTGASGLIGAQLASFLTTGGHLVDRYVRRRPDDSPTAASLRGGHEYFWDPRPDEPGVATIDPSPLDGADAVVHLAGENVATRPWNSRNLARIRESRVEGTRLMAEAIAARPNPPRVLVVASAVGYYGNRPGELLTEDSSPGRGFLAGVVRDWEAAAQPAIDAGVRVVFARIGLVLNAKGGVLGQMLPAARLGLVGRLGGGSQHWPWIGLDDCVGALHHLLMTDTIDGPVNIVAPGAETGGTTQGQLGRALAGVLRRPAGLDVPEWVLRRVFGSMFADETMLKSVRVSANRLIRSGFWFQRPHLPACLAWETGTV